MINREKLNDILNRIDSLEGVSRVELTVYSSGGFKLWAGCPDQSYRALTEEERRKVLLTLTPLVGKLEKTQTWGTDIDYKGSKDGIDITINRADKCKILGYKTKIVKKQKMVEVEGEFEEEEERVPITDCDVIAGRANESQIEIPA